MSKILFKVNNKFVKVGTKLAVYDDDLTPVTYSSAASENDLPTSAADGSYAVVGDFNGKMVTVDSVDNLPASAPEDTIAVVEA